MLEAVDGIKCDVSDGCVHVTLSSEDGENRLSPQMVDWMTHILHEPPSEADVLLLDAEGEAFCLGPQPAAAPELVRGLACTLIELNRALVSTRLTTMASVNGRAAGFGVGLACLPDLTIAGHDATFVLPEVQHDLLPIIVLSWLPEVIGEKAATWLALSGLPMNAADAAVAGLISRAVPSRELRATSAGLVARLTSYNPSTVGEVKRFVRDGRGLDRARVEQLAADRTGDWAERNVSP